MVKNLQESSSISLAGLFERAFVCHAEAKPEQLSSRRAIYSVLSVTRCERVTISLNRLSNVSKDIVCRYLWRYSGQVADATNSPAPPYGSASVEEGPDTARRALALASGPSVKRGIQSVIDQLRHER